MDKLNANYITHFCHVKRILENGEISAEDKLAIILRYITDNQLAELYIGTLDPTDDQLSILVGIIKANTGLISLILSRCHDFFMSDESIVNIANALKDNSTLIRLDLEGSYIKQPGMAALGQLLETNTTIKSLNLQYIHCDASHIETLCTSLQTNTTLKELWLGGMWLKHAATAPICKLLAHNTGITSLSFEHNQFEHQSLAQVFSALKNNHTLTELNVGGFNYKNPSQWDVNDALTELLRTNTTLKKLIIFGNSLEDSNVINVFEALKANVTLTELNIRNQEIGHQGLFALEGVLWHRAQFPNIFPSMTIDYSCEVKKSCFKHVASFNKTYLNQTPYIRGLASVLGDYLWRFTTSNQIPIDVAKIIFTYLLDYNEFSESMLERGFNEAKTKEEQSFGVIELNKYLQSTKTTNVFELSPENEQKESDVDLPLAPCVASLTTAFNAMQLNTPMITNSREINCQPEDIEPNPNQPNCSALL